MPETVWQACAAINSPYLDGLQRIRLYSLVQEKTIASSGESNKYVSPLPPEYLPYQISLTGCLCVHSPSQEKNEALSDILPGRVCHSLSQWAGASQGFVRLCLPLPLSLSARK